MTAGMRRALRKLEGQSVHVSLADGTRFDDVSLVSARGNKVWLFANGHDVFLAADDVVDLWEARPAA